MEEDGAGGAVFSSSSLVKSLVYSCMVEDSCFLFSRSGAFRVLVFAWCALRQCFFGGWVSSGLEMICWVR